MKLESDSPFEIHDLPWLAKWSYLGIIVSFTLAAIGSGVLQLVKLMNPGFVPMGEVWFVALLVVIWTPAVMGLICGYLTIIRYPYLSRVIQVTDPLIESPRSFVWRLLGFLLIAVGMMCLATLLMPDKIQILLMMAYVAITLIFGGFVLCFFSRTKHVTIATFLDVTMRIGFILVPLYLPALLIGYLRNRRFEKTLGELPCNAPDLLRS